MSNEWHGFYRYNVEKRWSDWKNIHASIHPEGSENGTALRRDMQLGRAADDPKRTTGRKARAETAENSKRKDGQQGRKSTRRVQGSTKKN